MNTQESVKKIKKKAKHYVDGNHIKVETKMPMPLINYNTHAYKSLEKAFDKLQYTEIRIIYGKSQRYNGNARVTFLDDENKDKINKVAEKKFDHCRITTEEI